MRPRCPQCRGPVERRAGKLLCSDRRVCKADVHPKSAILTCPKCRGDAWMVQGTIRGQWEPMRRAKWRMEGTVLIACQTGHRTRVRLPEEMAPVTKTKKPNRRGF
jgi:hypothetical protein